VAGKHLTDPAERPEARGSNATIVLLAELLERSDHDWTPYAPGHQYQARAQWLLAGLEAGRPVRYPPIERKAPHG
jgi:hypothetical protein